MKPRLYLTSAAAVQAVRRKVAREETGAGVGPGRVWTIMARPNRQRGQAGEGVVGALVPALEDLDAVMAGRITAAEYRERYLLGITGAFLAPGMLLGRLYVHPRTAPLEPVAEGDTLICGCRRERALRGECHTAYAAEALVAAGWDVRLHGLTLDEVRAGQGELGL